MKVSNKLTIMAVVAFVLIGLAAVSAASMALFKKNADAKLEQMSYTKILEMEEGLLPEKKLAIQLGQ